MISEKKEKPTSPPHPMTKEQIQAEAEIRYPYDDKYEPPYNGIQYTKRRHFADGAEHALSALSEEKEKEAVEFSIWTQREGWIYEEAYSAWFMSEDYPNGWSAIQVTSKSLFAIFKQQTQGK